MKRFPEIVAERVIRRIFFSRFLRLLSPLPPFFLFSRFPYQTVVVFLEQRFNDSQKGSRHVSQKHGLVILKQSEVNALDFIVFYIEGTYELCIYY